MGTISSNKILFFRKQIIQWYKKNGRDFPWRKKSRTKYEIIISEILLQRTRAETIFGYYFKFLKQYPNWQCLARANIKSLQKILQPVGLWQRRAESMLSLAKWVAQNKRLPTTRAELEQLPGIGQYIASAVLLIYHNKSEPLLDVNMARLLERFFGPRERVDIRYDPYLQLLSRRILPRVKIKEFNWAILDFSAMVCKSTNPNCTNCILNKKCFHKKNNKLTVDLLSTACKKFIILSLIIKSIGH